MAKIKAMKIAPCPHCKNPDTRLEMNYIYCDKCDMFGPTCKTQGAAIIAWNRLAQAARIGFAAMNKQEAPQ